MVGLGTAAKLYPVFLLVAVWTLAIRTRRWSEAGWATAAAAGTWLAANVPLAIAYHRGWWEFYRFSMDRATERSTLWAIGKTLFAGSAGSGDAVYWVPPGIAVALALIGALVAVVVLGLAAPTRPRLAQLAFLAVLAFLLTTKVWSPQYSLWLVPLAILAVPRWRILLAWMTVDALVWAPRMMFYLGDDRKGLPIDWFLSVVVLRDLAVVGLCALVVYEIYHPARDLVRQGAGTPVDDPAGGVLDGAPDRLTLTVTGFRRSKVPAGS
jgi:uncharacterized membrane protein